MAVTLDLRPELEARLQQRAAESDLSIEDFLTQAVEDLAPAPSSGAELLAYWKAHGVLGAWANREDISDSITFARELRREAEARTRG